MKTLLCTALASLACLVLSPLAALAQTSDFPTRPVTIVTPFPAGSGPDAMLRLVSDRLSTLWKQRVLVDNRPGAAGFIAMDIAKKTRPDGYTLLQLDSEHLAALPHLYKQRNFVTLQSFDPVAALYRTPFLVAVSSQSKWNSVDDLVQAAKARPRQLNYGSWGVGSPGHLGGISVEGLTGVTMVHVPFREMGQLFSAVAAGDVDWSLGSIPSSQGVYKAGKLKYLAVAGPRRLSQLPEVPTLAEAGGPPSLEVSSFVVLVAPKGIPAPLVARIDADVGKVLSDPDVKAQFDTFAFERLNWTRSDILANVEAKSTEYKTLIGRGGITLD